MRVSLPDKRRLRVKKTKGALSSAVERKLETLTYKDGTPIKEHPQDPLKYYSEFHEIRTDDVLSSYSNNFKHRSNLDK